MGTVVQFYALAVLQDGAGDETGGPLASAKTVNINVKEIVTVEVDTSVAGCNSRVTMKSNGGLPRILWSATTASTITTAINATT